MTTCTLALYTTLYPAARPYFSAWYASLRAQTDRDVDVWIGLDGIEEDEVCALAGERFDFTPVKAGAGWSVADLRNAAFSWMAERYDGIVFTDPDDWMLPERVAQARIDLEDCDACACAMRIADVAGVEMGVTFTLPPDSDPGSLMPTQNVFGLSNTAYRGALLQSLLPVPAETVLVDWLLASRAWADSARLRFNPAQLMVYRQHPNNTARVLPPFTPAQVLKAADLMAQHYRLMLESRRELSSAHRAQLEAARARLLAFQARMGVDMQLLQSYVNALNRLPVRHLWWSWVAHPLLDEFWMG